MSEHPVHNAFDYQTRHAERDFDAYLEGRPYQDANGGVHDPQTGKFIDSDKRFDQHRSGLEQAGQAEAYENLSVPELARKLAAADFEEDPTTSGSISEVLNDKLDALDDKYFSDRDDSSTRSTRDPDSGINHNELRSEKLWDRVMKIHDRELERLQEENKKPETEPEPPVPDGENGPDGNDEGNKGDATEPTTEVMPVVQAEPAEEEPPSDGALRPFDWERDAQGDFDEGQPDRPEPAQGEPGEELSDEPETAGGDQVFDQPEGRWDRFKRGARKHLHEAPVKETPMGPAIQATPYEEEQNRQADPATAGEQRNEMSRRRRLALALGVFAASVGLGLLGQNYNGSQNTEPAHLQNTPAKKGAAKLPGTPEVKPKTKIRLEAGENPWTESEQILKERGNAHPTPAEIQAFDMAMAEENPDVYSYYGDSSRHIPTGTELKPPKKIG